MSASARRQRAAAFINLHDSGTGDNALLFGRCGTDPSVIHYRLTIVDDAAPRHLRLRVRGDFTELLRSGILGEIGRSPQSVQLTANGKRLSATFEPDATAGANALIQTDAGLSGAYIEVQSSEAAAVAFCGLMVMGAMAWSAIAVGLEIEIHTEAKSGDTSATTDTQVDASDDQGGAGDGNGTGDPQ